MNIYDLMRRVEQMINNLPTYHLNKKITAIQYISLALKYLSRRGRNEVVNYLLTLWESKTKELRNDNR